MDPGPHGAYGYGLTPPMKHLEQIANLLFSDDPRAKSEKILASLIAESEARGGAVLALRNGRLQLFTGQDLSLEHLGKIEASWSSHAQKLQKSGMSKADGLVLAPLLERGMLNGVLVLDRPRAFDLLDTQLLRDLLARAVTTPPQSAQVRLDAAAAADMLPGHLVERGRLVDMLQRHEWNIAVVARHLGVTRRTIYLRMEKHGIERQVVPRTFKKTPALG
jgi:hypothetical protein